MLQEHKVHSLDACVARMNWPRFSARLSELGWAGLCSGKTRAKGREAEREREAQEGREVRGRDRYGENERERERERQRCLAM